MVQTVDPDKGRSQSSSGLNGAASQVKSEPETRVSSSVADIATPLHDQDVSEKVVGVSKHTPAYAYSAHEVVKIGSSKYFEEKAPITVTAPAHENRPIAKENIISENRDAHRVASFYSRELNEKKSSRQQSDEFVEGKTIDAFKESTRSAQLSDVHEVKTDGQLAKPNYGLPEITPVAVASLGWKRATLEEEKSGQKEDLAEKKSEKCKTQETVYVKHKCSFNAELKPPTLEADASPIAEVSVGASAQPQQYLKYHLKDRSVPLIRNLPNYRRRQEYPEQTPAGLVLIVTNGCFDGRERRSGFKVDEGSNR